MKGYKKMKNYATDLESQKDFINYFKYDQERSLLIIHYASGQVLPANCTKENMIKILKKMKSQVLNSVEFEQKIKRKHTLAIAMSVLAGLMITLMIFIHGLPFLLLLTSILTLSIGTNTILKTNRMLSDIKKNKLLINASAEITAKIKSLTTKEISNIIEDMTLKNVDIKDDHTYYMGLKDVPPININSIEDSSLEQMENLIKTLNLKKSKQERGKKL